MDSIDVIVYSVIWFAAGLACGYVIFGWRNTARREEPSEVTITIPLSRLEDFTAKVSQRSLAETGLYTVSITNPDFKEPPEVIVEPQNP